MSIRKRSTANINRRTVAGVLFGILVLSSGCSSSYQVSSSSNADPSFETFNVEAYNRSGTVVFHDGKEPDARNIVASPDSTRFVMEPFHEMTAVSTRTIKKIVFTNHGIGLLEGFGWGALGGAVTVLAIFAASPNPGSELSEPWIVAAFTAVGAGVGGVIGGIPGVIMGHSYEYNFATDADSTKQ
jgi:hypothetical protein